MKIVRFENRYLDEMSELFMRAYSEPGYEWDLKTTKGYLIRNIEDAPEYCLMAVSGDDECMGAVFCSIDPYYEGKMVFVDTLQVKGKFRKQGVAKALLAAVFEKAKEEQIRGVHFLVDKRAKFPKEWYESMGFEPTSWVEYEAEMEDIRL